MKITSYTVFIFCENQQCMDSICRHLNSIFSGVFPINLVIKPTSVVDTTDKWP